MVGEAYLEPSETLTNELFLEDSSRLLGET